MCVCVCKRGTVVSGLISLPELIRSIYFKCCFNLSNLCRIWPLPSGYTAALPRKAVKEHTDTQRLWPADRRYFPPRALADTYFHKTLATRPAFALNSSSFFFFYPSTPEIQTRANSRESHEKKTQNMSHLFKRAHVSLLFSNTFRLQYVPLEVWLNWAVFTNTNQAGNLALFHFSCLYFGAVAS